MCAYIIFPIYSGKADQKLLSEAQRHMIQNMLVIDVLEAVLCVCPAVHGYAFFLPKASTNHPESEGRSQGVRVATSDSLSRKCAEAKWQRTALPLSSDCQVW